jgi:hypothetical protein
MFKSLKINREMLTVNTQTDLLEGANMESEEIHSSCTDDDAH